MKKLLLLIFLGMNGCSAIPVFAAFGNCFEAACDSPSRCYLGRDSYYCEDRTTLCGQVTMVAGDICIGPPENLQIVQAGQFQGVLGQNVWLTAFVWGTLIFIAFSTRMRV